MSTQPDPRATLAVILAKHLSHIPAGVVLALQLDLDAMIPERAVPTPAATPSTRTPRQTWDARVCIALEFLFTHDKSMQKHLRDTYEAMREAEARSAAETTPGLRNDTPKPEYVGPARVTFGDTVLHDSLTLARAAAWQHIAPLLQGILHVLQMNGEDAALERVKEAQRMTVRF